MLHYYENNLPEEEKSSTTAGASSTGAGASSSEEEASSSSPDIGESSFKGWSTTARSWGVLVRSYTRYFARGCTFYYRWGGCTGCTAPRDRQYKTQSKSRGYLLQHARDRSALETKPSTTCVEFTYTERDPFRISEEENRVIKTPNDILRCHPLHGSTSPGITGT